MERRVIVKQDWLINNAHTFLSSKYTSSVHFTPVNKHLMGGLKYDFFHLFYGTLFQINFVYLPFCLKINNFRHFTTKSYEFSYYEIPHVASSWHARARIYQQLCGKINKKSILLCMCFIDYLGCKISCRALTCDTFMLIVLF